MKKKVAVSAAEMMLLADLTVPADFDRALRRADDFIKLAVVSAGRALNNAPPRLLAPSETGIFIGTAYGPLETNFCSLGSLIDDGEGQISPTLFSHSVYNAAAGYVSRLLTIHGPALTLTTYAWPFVVALDQARLAILSARIKRAVVIAVETYSGLLEDAFKRWHGLAEVPWQPGAVAWILEAADDISVCPLLAEIGITETACEPGQLLARAGEHWQGDSLVAGFGSHPMAYAFALTTAMDLLISSKTVKHPAEWLLDAPFGQARISLVF
ncbi:MAG: hypothetical protein A2511_02565 [Deltaproteobacteria bacterium RIFOXYD12_FULL_50_9]|nr:MAG: hypothetical protein A2511_02565 [Deltaproteobacteria bacterium RIFOXYD12_FULL_50_9]